ncbi:MULTISPECIES: MATE family efflux transporter [Clostridium]|uniref:MATE family efflux transporter n=1 Tax=Clostridium cadaveris TaxID=1529 RepID=A0A316M1F0_9CLOT|nr:MATE family efflux transporter [Clostridium cadaveris]MDU4953367.1 MATE family efflux transporter [Clostridium sp.]NME65455.1 MATE family efflux transporter [Clostridium cadaveris]NWK10565.1 polysaccharide biosynthesis C-terminal domain-containing protein [Clostridium cadaveris]PWL51941.1 MAG: MATE family efflux transporter [Clostridium cadaveris]
MTKNVYESYSDNRLIFLFAIPSIISLFLESLTSIIDTAFAGHIPLVSTESLTAIGLLSPVISILIAAQLLFGVSTGIFISRYLGKDDKKKVNDTFQVGFYTNLIFASSISLLLFIFMNPLLQILGAEGEVYILAKKYFSIALLSNVFSSVGYNLVNILRAFGYPKLEVTIASFSTVLNVIFNFIFTFKMDMGLTGIALGTLISEVFYTFSGAYFLYKHRLWFSHNKLSKNFIYNIITKMTKVGFVQFGVQCLTSLSGLVINNRLLYFGGAIGVSAWAVVQKIHSAALMPIVGITQGLMSILSYFKGNNNKSRAHSVTKKSILYSLGYGIIVTVIIFLFGDYVVLIFSDSMEIITASSMVLKICFSLFFMLGIVYTLISLFQVTDKEKYAMTLGFVRQLIALVPLSIILPMIFSKSPVNAIFFSLPLSDLLTLILGIYLYKSIKAIV